MYCVVQNIYTYLGIVMRFKRRVGKVRYLPIVSALRVTVLVTYMSFVQFGCSGWYVQDGTLLYPNLPLLGCFKT